MQLSDKIAMTIHDCGNKRQSSRLFQRLAYFAFHQSYISPIGLILQSKFFYFMHILFKSG